MPAIDGMKAKTGSRVVKVAVHVERDLRDGFAASARAAGFTLAGGIRKLMEREVGQQFTPRRASGSARKLNLRLSDAARASLLLQAEERGSSPAAWATAVLEAALSGDGRAVWGRREAEDLRALYAELKAVQPSLSDPAARDALHRAMLRLLKTLTGVEAKSR